MVIQFSIHEAKTQLPRLIERAERGEEIVIARGGRPIARLVPYGPKRRTPGLARGRGRLTEAFFAPLPPEALEAFGGGR
ncbi:MAG: type II toxin-antitoxin system Phd/YefM family antitoxin [Betaproteobacteria bacterium]